MASDESAGYIESHRPLATSSVARTSSSSSNVRLRQEKEDDKCDVTYRYINRYHRGCRNGKEVKGERGGGRDTRPSR